MPATTDGQTLRSAVVQLQNTTAVPIVMFRLVPTTRSTSTTSRLAGARCKAAAARYRARNHLRLFLHTARSVMTRGASRTTKETQQAARIQAAPSRLASPSLASRQRALHPTLTSDSTCTSRDVRLHSGSMTDDGYAIGELAALARVTVRTLHHYDDIGLLRPSGRTYVRHRRYSAEDLDRLRQILVYRELDFGLDLIATMLADPDSGVETRPAQPTSHAACPH